VLEKLLAAGMRPAPEADRPTLIRRLTFDLVGLPPTPEEIAGFVGDPSPDAYERLVDRLLAHPGYGERWGRHWLDVVRFAESEGFEYDRHRVGAWRYRDYVVASFNADVPYDRFLAEQLAGDEIGPADDRLLVAAGFHRLGPVRRNAGNQNVAFSRHEVLIEMTDAVGAAFLGLTVGCARCHDHKFDAILQSDYYRLQAYLAAAQENDVVKGDPEALERWNAETEKLRKEIKDLMESLGSARPEDRERLQYRIEELKKKIPPPPETINTIRNDESRRTPIYVLKRGDPDQPGERVGPRPLNALVPKGAAELPADDPAPRTRLAGWLNEPNHPLTARVLVNRVWQYHFGRGIVGTANDFGANGASPSHRELLDHLAGRFLDEGRALKPLHRRIVLSAAYRQSGRSPLAERGHELDPENRLLWHFPRRRLSAEEVRDAMLAASAALNTKAGGPSVIVPVEQDLVGLLYDPAQWAVSPNENEHNRRSVYLLVKRNLQLPFAQVFDQPDGQTSCSRRESSTHPLQALELLNGELSNRLADLLAERIAREAGGDPAAQARRGYELVVGRLPTPREESLAVAFLREQPLREFTLALFNLNAFLYVQ
jgi:hypothetical protein